MFESDRRVALHRVACYLVGYVGVAVAIAADPAPHAQERRHPRRALRPHRCELVLDVRVELGQLAQERVLVIGEPVLDLVRNGEPNRPQDARLPQRQHVAPDLFLVSLELGRRELHAVALEQEPRELALAVEHGASLHLGGMRGEHRRHHPLREQPLDILRAEARLPHARERQGEAAFLVLRVFALMKAAPAVVVQILRDVRELREERERPRDRDDFLVGQTAQHAFELALRGRVAIAAKAQRHLPRAFDQGERRLAVLLAQGVAEHAPEKPNVIAQRCVLVGLHLRRGCFARGAVSHTIVHDRDPPRGGDRPILRTRSPPRPGGAC